MVELDENGWPLDSRIPNPPYKCPPPPLPPRRATVTVIRAAGDPQLAGGLVDFATAREMRIKDAQIRVVERALERARASNAINYEALIAGVRIKYGPRPKAVMQRIGDQIGAWIAFAYCVREALRRTSRRPSCR